MASPKETFDVEVTITYTKVFSIPAADRYDAIDEAERQAYDLHETIVEAQGHVV